MKSKPPKWCLFNTLNGPFSVYTPYRLILCTLPGPLLFRAHSLFIGLRNSVPYIMYMYIPL